MTRLAALLSLIAAMALTGANVPFGKIIVADIPIYIFIALRFAVATIALMPLVRRETGPRLASANGEQFAVLLAMALVGSVLFTAFLLEGTKRTAAVDAGIITATLPAAVAILGLIFLRRRLSLPQASVIGLAVMGVVAIQATERPGAESSLAGNLLVIVAVLCEASFVIVSQRISGQFRPIRLAFAVAALSLACSLPLAIYQAIDFSVAQVSAGIWLLSIWYAVSASILFPILWFRGAAHVEPWMAGLATAAIPVTAIIVSALALGERIDPFQWAGAALVIAAIAVGALWTR